MTISRSSIWPLVLVAALILSTALGIRQTFGLFIAPLAADHIVTVGLLSFAIAIQNLIWGVAQPIAGGISDRFGPAPVVAGGAAIYAAGLLAVAYRPDALAIVIGFGVLVGLGQSAMTFAVVLSCVSRATTGTQRATAVALAAAGGSFGLVALVPIAQIAIAHSGFRVALVILAVVALAVAPAGLFLGKPRETLSGEPAPAAWPAIRTALRDPNFLFLTSGFFACGFQLAFMGVHLPGYLVACHVGVNVGAAALATIGFFNIVGSFGFGKAAGRIPPQVLLTWLYVVRATSTLIYIIVPVTALTTLSFAVIMGLTWLGTVPLTNAVVARLHGLPNLGVLFGVCFVGHQVGGFLGALCGGLSVQFTGSYTPMWIATIAVGYGAALLNIPIRFRSAPSPAAA